MLAAGAATHSAPRLTAYAGARVARDLRRRLALPRAGAISGVCAAGGAIITVLWFHPLPRLWIEAAWRLARSTGAPAVASGSPAVWSLGSVVWLLATLCVVQRHPSHPVGGALLSATVAVAASALSIMARPATWALPIRELAAWYALAALAHLALVFPADRLRRRQRPMLLVLYVAALLPAVTHDRPELLWRWVNVSPEHMVNAAFAMVVATAFSLGALHWRTTRSPLMRRRLELVALGALGAAALLGELRLLLRSPLLDWLPLSTVALGLAVACAVRCATYLEADTACRQFASWVLVGGALLGACLAAATVVRLAPRAVRWAAALPPLPAAVAVSAAVTVLAAAVRHWSLRILFPRTDASVLRALRQRLAGSRSASEVIAQARLAVAPLLAKPATALFARWDRQHFRQASPPCDPHADLLRLPSALLDRLKRGDVLVRGDWDHNRRALPALLRHADTAALVPLRCGAALDALLVVSTPVRHAFTSADIRYLHAVGDMLGLPLALARTVGALEAANLGLEGRLRDRDTALAAANAALARADADLRHTGAQVERTQQSLVRVDRLATLGRLAAGLAHEMNTPLSATLTSLKIIADLGREYAAAVDDAEITPADHREIANEIRSTAEAATAWTHKAVAFIRGVKALRRESAGDATERCCVRSLVAEIEALLIHRLRASGCRIAFEAPHPVALLGSPARLAQVLVNLVTNAIDAYEERGSGGPIEIQAEAHPETVRLTVRDQAGGIAPDALPHIFDEQFTTKKTGQGTGLGLWIARNIVADVFHGTLEVLTTAGVGSSFTISIPAQPPATGTDPAVAAVASTFEDLLEGGVAADAPALEHAGTDCGRFSVQSAVAEACAALAGSLRTSSCTLGVQQPRDAIHLAGDVAEFRQLVTTLVRNAVGAYDTARRSGTRRIELSIRRTGKRVQLAVRDFAGGIPLQELPRLFERRADVDDCTQSRPMLWLARTIVENSFGGLLDVLTASGGGSCFMAVLPIVRDGQRPLSIAPAQLLTAERRVSPAAPVADGAADPP